jgi:hypothetical protein
VSGLAIGYPDWSLSWVFPVSPGKCQGTTFKFATTSSFQIHSDSPLMIIFQFHFSLFNLYIETASLSNLRMNDEYDLDDCERVNIEPVPNQFCDWSLSVKCLTHTHHLGIDTQLFALSPLFVYAVWRWPRIGLSVLAGVAAVSTALRYSVTYSKHLTHFVIYGSSWV